MAKDLSLAKQEAVNLVNELRSRAMKEPAKADSIRAVSEPLADLVGTVTSGDLLAKATEKATATAAAL